MAQGPGEVEEGTIRMAARSTAETAAALTTDDIRSQIEQTRAEMSGTIDAIQTRLSPARAIADAKDGLTDSTVGRLKRLAQRTPDSSGRSVLETARAIPWPVALATASVGLIVRALNNGNRRRPTHATLNDGGERDRRERTNQASGHGNRRLVAAASAAAACWALWRAQTPASRSGNAYPPRQEG